MANELQQVLNTQISSWNVLYVKLHNYHWYVKGEQFFTLHLKFEELYNEAALHIDELAERLLALGGTPLATMKEYLTNSLVGEAAGTEDSATMVATIVSDFGKLIEHLKSGMNLAADQGDETTGDMLLAIHKELEKHVWMLKAFLGKRVI